MTPDKSGPYIQLTHGRRARVSPEDLARFGRFSWYSQVGESGSWFAARVARRGGRKRTVLLQREIFGPLPRNAWTLFINGDTLDCRRENIIAIRHRRVYRRLRGQGE